MSKPRVTKRGLLDDTEEATWLFSLLGLIVRAGLAFVTALIVYVLLYRLSYLPQFSMIDATLRPAMFWVMLALAVGFLLTPLFQTDWSIETRSFSMMSALMLVLVAFGEVSGYLHVDPMQPFDKMIRTSIPSWVARINSK
jgi:hypothetical protein